MGLPYFMLPEAKGLIFRGGTLLFYCHSPREAYSPVSSFLEEGLGIPFHLAFREMKNQFSARPGS